MEYNLDYLEENIDYDDMTSEKTYQIVAKEFLSPTQIEMTLKMLIKEEENFEK